MLKAWRRGGGGGGGRGGEGRSKEMGGYGREGRRGGTEAPEEGEEGGIVLEPVNFGVIFRKILIDNMTNAIHIQEPPVIVEDEEPNGMTACRGPRRLSLTQSRSQPYMDADPSQPRVVEGK